MGKKPQKPKLEEVETETDVWERFQKTMDRIAPPKRQKPKDKGRSDADRSSRVSRRICDASSNEGNVRPAA